MAVHSIQMKNYHQEIDKKGGWWSEELNIDGYNFQISIQHFKEGHVTGNVWFVPGEYPNLHLPVTLSLQGEIQDKQTCQKIHCGGVIKIDMENWPNKKVSHHATLFTIGKSVLDTAVGKDDILYIQVNHLNIQDS